MNVTPWPQNFIIFLRGSRVCRVSAPNGPDTRHARAPGPDRYTELHRGGLAQDLAQQRVRKD